MDKYISGKYHGKPVYQCPGCPFNDLHADILEKHLSLKPAHDLKSEIKAPAPEAPTVENWEE